MINGQYEVEILVHGKKIKEYNQFIEGEYKTFIEGKENSEYQVKISNNSYRKVLAICNIDSVNVVTGKVAKSPTGGRGYIINPYDSVVIKGYRETDSTVGAFKFTSKHKSYAAEKGVEYNSGV